MKNKTICVIGKNGIELVTCGDTGCHRQSVIFVVEDGKLEIKVGDGEKAKNANN